MTNLLEFSVYAIPTKTKNNYLQTPSTGGDPPQIETAYNKQPQNQLADTICNPPSAESYLPQTRAIYSTSHPRTLSAIRKSHLQKGIQHMQEQASDIIPADIIHLEQLPRSFAKSKIK